VPMKTLAPMPIAKISPAAIGIIQMRVLNFMLAASLR